MLIPPTALCLVALAWVAPPLAPRSFSPSTAAMTPIVMHGPRAQAVFRLIRIEADRFMEAVEVSSSNHRTRDPQRLPRAS